MSTDTEYTNKSVKKKGAAKKKKSTPVQKTNPDKSKNTEKKTLPYWQTRLFEEFMTLRKELAVLTEEKNFKE